MYFSVLFYFLRFPIICGMSPNFCHFQFYLTIFFSMFLELFLNSCLPTLFWFNVYLLLAFSLLYGHKIFPVIMLSNLFITCHTDYKDVLQDFSNQWSFSYFSDSIKSDKLHSIENWFFWFWQHALCLQFTPLTRT